MRYLVVLILTAVLLTGGLLRAQSASAPKSGRPAASAARQPAAAAADSSTSAAKSGKLRRPVAITPEREVAALNFVQRNHPELADLLGYLKDVQSDEYDRAIREIYRTTERLAQIQERDPVQYDLEVAAWTAQSHVQLLAAELKMSSSEDLIKRLRQALVEQSEARLALIKHERKKAADRLAKLDNDIARLEKDRDTLIERQLKVLTRGTEDSRPGKAGSTKSGPKTAVKARKPTT